LTRTIPSPSLATYSEAISHIGASPRRTLLEDRSRVGLVRTAAGLSIILSVVSDGIGGESAGERAAELTVTTIFDHVARSSGQDVLAILDAALQEAHRRVVAEAKASRRKTNMGATAAVAAVLRDRLYVANVGDSGSIW
jgi:serine/threonine protein phosphatase PrpC